MPNTLNFEVKDRIGYVQFSTPDTMNSITEERIDELAWVVQEVRRDVSIRALSITGSGRAFCVGLDYGLLKRAFADFLYFEKIIRRLNVVLLELESLPVPVIAAINGITRAGGFELSLACDLMVIADEARIGDVHTNLGVLPGGGATQRLPRRVGEQRAKELIWSARWLNGAEAVTCGLALRSVPLASLPSAVEDICKDLRHRPRECLGATKRCLNAARDLDIRTGIEYETRAFVDYMAGLPHGLEGYRASLEGRPPNWY